MTEETTPTYNLADAGTVTDLGIKLQALLDDGDRDEIFSFTLSLDKTLREKFGSLEREQPDLYRSAQEIVARGGWATLNRQLPEEVTRLFANYFQIGLSYDWEEIKESVDRVLIATPDLQHRDLIKQNIRLAMGKSHATIGNSDITLGEQKLAPTVANWIKVWREFIKDDTATSLKVIEFFNSNVNAQLLNKDERGQLEGVFKLNLELMKSSNTPEGIEDQPLVLDAVTGHYFIFDHGEMRDTGVAGREEDVKSLRFATGYTPEGKPMPISEFIKTSPSLKGLLPKVEPIISSNSRPNLDESVGDKDGFQPAKRYQAPNQQPDSTPSELSEKIDEPAPAVSEPKPVVESLVQEPKPVVSAPISETPQVSGEAGLSFDDFLPPVSEDLSVQEDKNKAKLPEVSLPELKEAEPVVAPQPDPAPIPEPAPAPPAPPAPRVQPKASAPKNTRTSSKVGIDYSDLAAQVLAEHNLLLSSYDMERRFLSVITSYLRGIRDRIESRESLTKSPQEGGVDLSIDQIDPILDSADALLKQVQSTGKSVSKRPAETVRSTAPRLTFDMAKQQVARHAPKMPKPVQGLGSAPLGSSNAISDIEDIFANISPNSDTIGPVIIPDSRVKSITDLKPQPVMTDVNSSGRNFPASSQPLVMGPIEELSSMTALEFRRLGATPEAAVSKIIEKIELLGQESIQKKSDGITAWKESPLNNEYLEIGRESFERSVPVEGIIESRKRDKPDGISITEFQAISDINKQLRF
ncbi:MAG: hypothetical protein COW24_06060 [Candidatus Kerfeldbacteria bacterium CG15_BIG_FIL_POST_REV_8_21_14_020_45_12]|uniref:Uncharacterized protein n=1 Tax=Candidatus Kerfeldbacteria bacterium CG15_BIG_FIL_POST_REV_8_21_14_020_45_12 TaxID=2014247 RepID=A0A2M7H274_9BACT|nr:MAG: hypothetical protein COW24_06060 [Candidatus Kerfeldbacteria bacterium CG15_BIG_FIL_POST_REV_8_21_14_020_45_12]PJA92891.1 MAG: hypothetical protein CO132_05850 [Candidatus Kerfeldbacteria bacterium CG_4_9_14_3_um_filter_45_8]